MNSFQMEEEKRKFLNELKKEVLQLEKKLKHERLENWKRKQFINLKILANVGRFLLPYSISASIFLGIFHLFHVNPFLLENHPINLITMKELDSLGNIRMEEEYKTTQEKGYISFYGKWQLDENGNYFRMKKKYELPEITEEEILSFLKGEKVSFEPLFENPISSIKEISNQVSKEDLQNDDYYQIIYYVENENDFILVKESGSENFASVLFYVLAVGVSFFVIAFIRESCSSYSFWDSVHEIKAQDHPLNTAEITRELMLKRDNLERLLR